MDPTSRNVRNLIQQFEKIDTLPQKEAAKTAEKSLISAGKTSNVGQAALSVEAKSIEPQVIPVKTESQAHIKEPNPDSQKLGEGLEKVAEQAVKPQGRALPRPNIGLPPSELPPLPTGRPNIGLPPSKLPPLPAYQLKEIDPQALAQGVKEVNAKMQSESSSNKLSVTQSAIKMIEDFKSGDPEKVETAKAQIRGLSKDNLKTLFNLADSKNVSNEKMASLNRALNKPTSRWDTFFNTTSTSKVLNRLHDKLTNPSNFHTLDASYKTDGKGICDIAYVNNALGFAYVVDGAGHDSELMANGLNQIFNQFNTNYVDDHKNKSLNRELVKGILTELEQSVRSYDQPIASADNKFGTKLAESSMQPAMSFVQIMPGEGNSRKLLSAEYEDTMHIIMHAKTSPEEKASFYKPNLERNLNGVGHDKGIQPKSGKGPDRLVEENVNVGDVVYLFSDGIGEFLSLEEVENVLSANVYPHLLVNEFKTKIIAKGVEFRNEMAKLDSEAQVEFKEAFKSVEACNKGNMKFHDPDDEKNIDDLSLVILKVT